MVVLENVINHLLADVSNVNRSKILPSFIANARSGIAYNITPLTGGVVKQSQLEVRVIDPDIDEALSLSSKIEEQLDMTPDKPSISLDGVVLRSQQAGGGSPMFQDIPQAWEIGRYYIITWRCIE